MPKPLATEAVRAWFYRIAGPIEALAIAYGVLDKNKAALWLALVSAVLTNGSAIYHTSTKGA